MIEMNAVVAGTELDAARDAGREGASAGWCAWSAGDASLTFSLIVRPDVNMHAFHGLPLAVGVFAGLDIWGRATIKTDAGEQEFPPEAVRIRGL